MINEVDEFKCLKKLRDFVIVSIPAMMYITIKSEVTNNSFLFLSVYTALALMSIAAISLHIYNNTQNNDRQDDLMQIQLR